jgi:cytochrome c-type biogenesis protein CcmH
VLAGPALAVTPDEQLADPRLEARAVNVSRELRCVVCQNQTIDDSDAPLAHDLRVLLRERLKAGDTDAQAKAFIVARYGHYVLLRPPVEGQTLVLWFGPALALLLAILAATLYVRSSARPRAGGEDLTAQEQAEVDRLLSPSDPQ